MDNVTTSGSAEYAAAPAYLAQSLQPDYFYENQYDHRQNCLLFSAVSYPYAAPAACGADKRGDESYVYYQLTNNVHSYRWYLPKAAPQPAHKRRQPAQLAQSAQLTQSLAQSTQSLAPSTQSLGQSAQPLAQLAQPFAQSAQPLAQLAQLTQRLEWSPKKQRGAEDGAVGPAKLSSKMHPVQLLHQIFRKEAFVMEYERINDGPFSRVRVTYKVNGRAYVAEATRLKEARRLCAKQVLRDQFPHLRVDSDDDIPRAEYDVGRFDNKHPVQILYQIFRYEPMEMHCEEEGAAHFAKHIFTFVIRGVQYQAKAETIKEAKRRAAILALNEYFKREAPAPADSAQSEAPEELCAG